MVTRREWARRSGRKSISEKLGRGLALQIRMRDNNKCVYCGATEETSGARLHFDHLTPKKQGGVDASTNLVLACRACNCARKTMPLERWCRERGLDARAIRAQARRPLPRV